MGKKLPSLLLTYLFLFPALMLKPAVGIGQSTATIGFASETASVNEREGTASLVVILLEANGTVVRADVVFSDSSSDASGADVGNFSSQIIHFNSNDTQGATRTITVPITNDTEFEGAETTVFHLQNNSGSTVNPGKTMLRINDDDSPDVVINEVLYNPRRDANGDGLISTKGDEFIELVNNGSTDIDISNWTLSVDSDIKFEFPAGTIISAKNAFVVFADPAEGIGFGGAHLFSAGTLDLPNSGGQLILSDARGNSISRIQYDDSARDESITRSPDVTGVIQAHSMTQSGATGALFSPGTRSDGTPFGSGHAVGLRGGEGWRLLASPAEGTTFDNLFADFWTQGVPGSDIPSGEGNLYLWQENSRSYFSKVEDMNRVMEPGKGYAIYVYEDDDYRTPGIQGSFPKTVRTDHKENTGRIRVPVSSTDLDGNGNINGNEGFNLLGNPFGKAISATAVINALETVNRNVSTSLQIWDPNAGNGNGAFIPLSGERESPDIIAPFQAFFARYTVGGISGDVSLDRSQVVTTKDAQFYNRTEGTLSTANFEMLLGGGNKFDTYRIAFHGEGSIGEDRYDAYKLPSLNDDAINFFSTVGEDVLLSKNVLPSLDSIAEGEELRISLGYSVPQSMAYSFSWRLPEQLPEDYEFYFIDNETGQQVDMRSRNVYQADLSQTRGEQIGRGASQRRTIPMEQTDDLATNTTRFELKIVRLQKQVNQAEPMEKPVILSPNYPNPFNSQTRMDLDLQEQMHVRVTIWNIVGQQVAMMKNEVMDAGQDYPLIWNVPANMPSGIYICKVEAGGTVITRKMTLVK